jgi:hypothetical protein
MRASAARRQVLPVAAVTLLALAACANPPPGQSPTDGDRGPAATYRGPLTQAVDDPLAGIVLEIPHAQPKVPWQTVYNSCASSPGTCEPTSAPTIDLAVATTPGSGHSKPDGSITPTVDHRLAYVLTWHGLPCVAVGEIHPTNSTATPTPVTPSQCTKTVLADATTGAFVYETEGTSAKE